MDSEEHTLPSTVEKVIQALDSTRPERLTVKNCPRCDANTPVLSRAEIFDCSECTNRGVEVDLRG